MKLVGVLRATDIHWNEAKRYGNNSNRYLMLLRINILKQLFDPGLELAFF
jgi:hypothetical protein